MKWLGIAALRIILAAESGMQQIGIRCELNWTAALGIAANEENVSLRMCCLYAYVCACDFDGVFATL